MTMDNDCGEVNWWICKEVCSACGETTCDSEYKVEWMDNCGGKREDWNTVVVED